MKSNVAKLNKSSGIVISLQMDGVNQIKIFPAWEILTAASLAAHVKIKTGN